MAGVLPFAKRGDNRTNNLIRLQQMFPRIVAADFHLPMHVSQPCQDLLRRMLTADPEKRITISQVLQHPWLQAASPPCTKVRALAITHRMLPGMIIHMCWWPWCACCCCCCWLHHRGLIVNGCGSQGLNEQLLQQLAPEGLQTVQEIEALVTQVAHAPPALPCAASQTGSARGPVLHLHQSC